MSMEDRSSGIIFKKKGRKNIRTRKVESDEDDQKDKGENDVTEKVEMYKELRKLRQKSHGVSVVTLALGKKAPLEEEHLGTDPFKSLTGGMVDMEALKQGSFQPKDDAYDTGIGTQFSAETNTRDEDAEMLKYIEEQLNERKAAAAEAAAAAANNPQESSSSLSGKFLSPEEAAMMAVPEYLRKSSSNKSEEMLSNQMLSGIPEIDLGIEVKIKNIEATEEAKQKILRDRLNKKEGPSQFVPTNMAVNFVQHNRFNIEDHSRGGGNHGNKRPLKQKEPEKPKKVVVVGAEPEELDVNPAEKEKGEKATDDFHFEKFKKQFRRF